jgi:hypothetical protein
VNDAGQRLQVVIVEVPSAGSPEPQRSNRPPAYPRNSREPWRPRTTPPMSRKAKALKNLVEAIAQQDEVVRSMMKPDLALLKARYGG